MVELPQLEYIRKNNSIKCNSPKCPECGSQRIWKDGIRHNVNGEIQRYLCRECGHRFSEPNVKINIPTQTGKLLHPSTNLTQQMVSNGKTTFKKSLDSSLLFRSENIGAHSSKPHHHYSRKGLNYFLHYNSDCHVCVSEQEAKNLSQQSTRQKQAAGATKHDEAIIKGKIVELAWQLKRNGYSRHTIQNYTRFLFTLMKLGANLYDPENVKEVIAKQEAWS